MLCTNSHMFSCLTVGSAFIYFVVSFFGGQYPCLLLSCNAVVVVHFLCGYQGLVRGPNMLDPLL